MSPRIDKAAKISRRESILQALARELEEKPGERITTAQLAKAVGVSEAALYRHFPSKAKMFEGLIEFIEDTIFSLVNRILDEEKRPLSRCEKILSLLLGFAEKNPGMTRLLVSDALVGEKSRLRERINQFYERVETQLKQVLRESRLQGAEISDEQIKIYSRLLLSIIEGRLHRYVRSDFSQPPLADWLAEWQIVTVGMIISD
ncbi:MAG: nucleoid occlusion factor SlmA [Sulfuriflexus sp.]|nr:nucleoid occlusion factor SlmA [Sulfuriflexus sp.]